MTATELPLQSHDTYRTLLMDRVHKLRTAALERSVKLPRRLPQEVASRIEFAHNLPSQAPDQRLKILVDADARPASMRDSGELPPRLVKEIRRAAEDLQLAIPPREMSEEELYALARAAEDLHDPQLMEEVSEVAAELPKEYSHPGLSAAAKLAVHSNGLSFRDALREVSPQNREIPMSLSDRDKLYAGEDPHEPLQPDYDYLFDSSKSNPMPDKLNSLPR